MIRKFLAIFAIALVMVAPANLSARETRVEIEINLGSGCGGCNTKSYSVHQQDYIQYGGGYGNYVSGYDYRTHPAYEAEYGPSRPRYRSASGILRYHPSTARRSFEKRDNWFAHRYW